MCYRGVQVGTFAKAEFFKESGELSTYFVIHKVIDRHGLEQVCEIPDCSHRVIQRQGHSEPLRLDETAHLVIIG